MRVLFAAVLLPAVALLVPVGAAAQADSTQAGSARGDSVGVHARPAARSALFFQLEGPFPFIIFPTLNAERSLRRGLSLSVGVALPLQLILSGDTDDFLLSVPVRLHALRRSGPVTMEAGPGVYALLNMNPEAGEPFAGVWPFVHVGLRFADGHGAAFRVGGMVMWEGEDDRVYPLLTLAVATDR